MKTSFNPAIPGYLTDYTKPFVQIASRRFLLLLSTTLSLSFYSLMFSALLGAERYLAFFADLSVTNAAIIACGAMGISGAIGGALSSIALLLVRP